MIKIKNLLISSPLSMRPQSTEKIRDNWPDISQYYNRGEEVKLKLSLTIHNIKNWNIYKVSLTTDDLIII